MDPNLPQPLTLLYREIGETTERIAREHPWWPCRKGCGFCCYLQAAPVATEYEWNHALPTIRALPLPLRRAIVERARRFGDHPERMNAAGATACPFLENEACSIYPARPSVCRTYGMYMYRGGGHWCELVEDALMDHHTELPDIVFGNIAPVHKAVDRLGSSTVVLPAWLERQAAAGALGLDDDLAGDGDSAGATGAVES